MRRLYFCAFIVLYAIWGSGCQQNAGSTAADLRLPPAPLTPRDPTTLLDQGDVAGTVAALTSPLAPRDAHRQFLLGVLHDIGVGVPLDNHAALDLLAAAATAGDAAAQGYLAWRCESGFGLEKPDPSAAARWIAEAQKGTPGKLPREWLQIRDGRVVPDFKRAFEWISHNAAAGNPTAAGNLALVYLSTHWTQPSAIQHLFWLKRAGDLGDAPSLERLALYYQLGLFVEKDPQLATRYQREAAAAGSADAQFELANDLVNQEGVTPDWPAAVAWYEKAAAQDHIRALVKLGDILREGRPGVPVDYARSLGYAKRAMALDSTEAMTDVAGMIRSGQGTEKNPQQAAMLYQRAAQKGYAHAADMLGWMYLQGELGEPDYQTARHWFEQAAERGNTHAMRQLGLIYLEAKGVPKDPATAFRWTERAAREGDPWSENRMGWMLRQGIGIERDDEEAVTWFRLAAKDGDPWGEANLGFHYRLGLGVPKDRLASATHSMAAARQLDDEWVNTNLMIVLSGPPLADQGPLRDLVLKAAQGPGLLDLPGSLPEACVRILNLEWMQPEGSAIARKLVGDMIAHNRRQSYLLLANHAFMGLGMPYDLERCHTWLHLAEKDHPKTAQCMLATYDSVAAPDPAVREAARQTLHRLADDGDVVAANTLIYRLMAGEGEPPDPDQALQRYNLLATHTKGMPPVANVAALAKQMHLKLQKEPSPEELAQLIAAAKARFATAADHSPIPVYRSPPKFPVMFRLAGIEGQAIIEFTVDKEGIPQNLKVHSETHPLFGIAAKTSVQTWRFLPATEKGKPVATRMRVPVIFQLNPLKD